MGQHKNARLTPKGREQMVRRITEQAERPQAVATACGLSAKTVRKWVRRFAAAGVAGLVDRSSRPQRVRAPTPAPIVDEVRRLRAQRWPGVQIAAATRLSCATVSRILRRLGLQQLPPLIPPPPVRRYEHDRPGQLLHLDTKKLARIAKVGHRMTGNPRDETRGAGWEFAHVCVDDHSRVAYAQVLPDERRESAVAFLDAAVAYYQQLGVMPVRVMTDNGSCYRSAAFRKACSRHGLKHLFTKPYTPRTNGKAERFIKSGLREWAYAQAYSHSDERTRALQSWLHRYNWHRPHRSLNRLPPISRMPLPGNNVLSPHS